MEFKNIYIATAKICGLENKPYYFQDHCYYAWDIYFEKTSSLSFFNISYINLGKTKEQAMLLQEEYKKNFLKAKIYNNDKVAIMYANGGNIIAVGKHHEDIWIDVQDQFKVKKFKDFNIIVTSLTVH